MEFFWTYLFSAAAIIGFYSFLLIMSTSTFINEMANGTMFDRISTLRW